MNYQSAGVDRGKTRKCKTVLRGEARRLNFVEKDLVTAVGRLERVWRGMEVLREPGVIVYVASMLRLRGAGESD